MKLKVIQIGNSTGIIFPREILNRLKIQAGDEVFVTYTPDGILISPCSPDFESHIVKEVVEGRTKMKTIEYYMKLPYKIEIIPDTLEGGYGARIPELPGCITCGDTVEITIKNAEEAKREWILSALEDRIPIPEPQLEEPISNFSGQFKLRLPKTLHKALAMQARKEGISMNQYCMYLLSSNHASHTAG